jgi:hypothetical protein
MLDFNRNYYDDTCSHSPYTFSRFEPKPGKNEYSGTGPGLPQTFRINESNADEKRSCLCRKKDIAETQR